MLQPDSMQTNVNTSKTIALHDNLNESTIIPYLVIQKSDPPYFRNLPYTSRLSLSIAMVCTSIIGTYFKMLLYKGIFWVRKETRGWMHRPINILILLSSVIRHTTHLITNSFGIHALLSSTPPIQIFGPLYCTIINIITTFGVVYLASGSFGIAVYRIMYIRFENFVKYRIGEKKLVIIISLGSLLISSAITYLHKIEESGDRVANNICFGMSPTQTQALINYHVSTDNNLLTTDYFRKTALLATLIMMFLELVIYIYICIWRYRYENGDITQLLDPTVTKRRNTNNILTFMGQFYEFLVEIMILAALLLLNHLIEISSSVSHIVVSLTFIVYILNFGILSAVEVLLSPALQSKTWFN